MHLWSCMMNSKQNRKSHVLVDLDRTLFDTGRFIDRVWTAIAKEYAVDSEYERQRSESFYTYYEDWYDYDFFNHIATISSIDSPQDEFEKRIRLHLTESFLFADAIETLSLYDEILTFGNESYQRFKLSVCPELQHLPVTIIREMKADYITRHYNPHVALIDDKNLASELPDWVDFFLIDREQQLPVVQHSTQFTSVSSLKELTTLL
jgi:hypothetical protein